MSDFRKLAVWRKAHRLAMDIHRVACRIRGSNSIGTRTQMIRAAQSVPTNIVESRGQLSRREACRFLRMAVNSSSELEYHLLVAAELKLVSIRESETLTGQVVEVRKMLYGLIRSLSKNSTTTPGLRSQEPR